MIVCSRLPFVGVSFQRNTCCALFRSVSSVGSIRKFSCIVSTICAKRFAVRCTVIERFRGFLSTKSSFLSSQRGKATSPKNSSILRYKSAANDQRERIISATCYCFGTIFIFIGLTIVAIPVYRLFCQSSGVGGTVADDRTHARREKDVISSMKSVKNRLIKVLFHAAVNDNMPWTFEPLQNEIYLYPGETSLAFFKAKNLSDRPIVGISTYNVLPFEVGKYFCKIQCFCFEEQILNPGEDLEMPVFFYLDPDIAFLPQLDGLENVCLSYTFFESNIDLVLPRPSFEDGTPLPLPSHVTIQLPKRDDYSQKDAAKTSLPA